MSSENRKKTVPFVCPRCLAEYRLCEQKIKTPKCDLCGYPLERIKNRR